MQTPCTGSGTIEPWKMVVRCSACPDLSLVIIAVLCHFYARFMIMNQTCMYVSLIGVLVVYSVLFS